MIGSSLSRFVSRLFSRSTTGNRHKQAIESLEPRRLLSTTMVYDLYFESWDPPYIASGVTDTYNHTAGTGIGAYFWESPLPSTFADSFTVTLDDLPAHTMIKASWSVGPYVNIADSEDVDGFTMTAAGKTQTVTIDSEGYGGSGNANGWTAHSGDSATFSLTANNLEWDDGIQWEQLTVYVYNPTVSLVGAGTTIEDDSTRGSFTLQRDLPTGFNPTYHDPVPATTVGLEVVGGTATAGVDFTLASSATIPTSGSSSEPVEVVPIDDPDAEGVETIFASLTQPANGQIYLLAAVPSTAPTTNPTTQKVDLDDDVKVQSITVTRGSASNASYGYSFQANIKITGEHLDQVQIRQQIISSTSLIDYDGNNLTRAQVLAKYPDSDPVSVDTNGQWETDTNWAWQNVAVKPDTKNGEANHVDNQLIQVPGGDIVELDATHNTQINWVAAVTRYFKLETRKATANTALATFDWGYKWNNYNCIWTVATGAPKASCVASHKGIGVFYDIQGITDLDQMN